MIVKIWMKLENNYYHPYQWVTKNEYRFSHQNCLCLIKMKFLSFWLEFFSRFFRLVGFWLLITTHSFQHFSPKVWTDSFSVDETLEVACLTDFSILELCFSSPSLHWLCQQAQIWQHFVFIKWRGQYFIFEAWNLKFIILHYTISLCKITTCSDVFWPFLFPR